MRYILKFLLKKTIDLESDAKDVIDLGEVAYWIDGKCYSNWIW